MATKIEISIGSLSSARTFANDAKAQETLLLFFDAVGLIEQTGQDATNQEKLDAVVDWIVGEIVGKARLHYSEDQRSEAIQDAQSLYGFE